MIAMVYCVELKRHSFLIYRLKKEYDHGFLSHLSFLPKKTSIELRHVIF
jgi:hypothetical protein